MVVIFLSYFSAHEKATLEFDFARFVFELQKNPLWIA